VAGLGVLVAWVGYSLFYYGLDQIRGGNNGLLSLMVPGKYTNQPGDSPGLPAAETQGGGVANTGTGAGTGANLGSVGSSGTPGKDSSGNPLPNIAFPTTAPKGAPKGRYGVDVNGNVYVWKNGGWQLYRYAGQTAPVTAV
jgi:hypothetical protein